MFTVRFNADAEKDLRLLQRKSPQVLTKLAKLLDELKVLRVQEQGNVSS